MSYFTKAEIIERIKSIAEAIDVIVTSGQSYQLDTGHGRQQVSRANLQDLRNQMEYWEKRLDEIDNPRRNISGEVFR